MLDHHAEYMKSQAQKFGQGHGLHDLDPVPQNSALIQLVNQTHPTHTHIYIYTCGGGRERERQAYLQLVIQGEIRHGNGVV